MKNLNSLSKEINEITKANGFNNNDFILRMILIHSELSEALEAFRKDKFSNKVEFLNSPNNLHWKDSFETYIKDSLEDELADCLIRLLDLCAYLNIDIDWHVENKMEYNKKRGFKYGGKKF